MKPTDLNGHELLFWPGTEFLPQVSTPSYIRCTHCRRLVFVRYIAEENAEELRAVFGKPCPGGAQER